MPKYSGSGDLFEKIPSEEEDNEVSLRGYDILSYPADFTLEVLDGKWKKGEIKIPPMQRRFIWTQARASKLIESFLMGLPVPPVFFYQERGTNKLLVVDGQQRLRSIVYFFSGLFGEKDSKDGEVVFNLIGLDHRSPYHGSTYQQFIDSDEQALNKLNNSVMRSFVVKQIDPADDTSIFQIFERLNTGGVILQGQEIRNCIYDGPFNDLLNKLNKYQPWRKLFGHKAEDKRKRDIELILRFLALFYNRAEYEKPMKQFLNSFMKLNRRATETKLVEFQGIFTRTCDAIHAALGDKPFHIRTGFNAAVYDSTFTAFAGHLNDFNTHYATQRGRANLRSKFELLVKNKDYLQLVGTGTTDEDIIPKRIKMVGASLFG